MSEKSVQDKAMTLSVDGEDVVLEKLGYQQGMLYFISNSDNMDLSNYYPLIFLNRAEKNIWAVGYDWV